MPEREAEDAIRERGEDGYDGPAYDGPVPPPGDPIRLRTDRDGHVVSYTQYAALDPPAEIPWSPDLERIVLWHQLPPLPAGIPGPSRLRVVELFQMDRTVEIPEELPPSLRRIVLSGCSIRCIPDGLVRSGLPFHLRPPVDEDEEGIFLDGSDLLEGDLTLFAQSREMIEASYRPQTIEVRECKVIFLGDSGSGKSSLIGRIIADKFEEGPLPTGGVKISSWDTTIDEKDFRLRILDFSGPEILHSMGRTFLTAHTVYVVVCGIRSGADLDLDAARWLEAVHAFAPGCPVILALNKADLDSDVSVNERALREIDGDLRCVLKTSAKWERERGVADLIYAIQIAVPDRIGRFRANEDVMGVERELEQMREDHIDADEYRRICLRHQIEDPVLQRGILDWCRDRGVAYSCAREERTDALPEDLRVLGPAWVANGIDRLFRRVPTGGLLSHEEIRRLLAEKDPLSRSPDEWYAPRETDCILHVMRTFQLSCEIAEGEELIPGKLYKVPPEICDEFPKEGALHLRWTAAYLPNVLIHRMMIRKVDELDRDCMWRTGAWSHRGIGGIDGCDALAEMRERSLDVYVSADGDARPYMKEFRDLVRQILSELGIHGEEIICCTIDGQEGQIPYEDVVQQYQDGREEVYIPGIRKYISPAALLRENYV